MLVLVLAVDSAFWKPGTIAPGIDVERVDEGDAVGSLVKYNVHQGSSMKTQRMMLPIYAKRTQILYAVEHYQTVVIVGQTGSGKSTQIPQYLHEAGWTAGNRMVCCTQPRRVAATSLAGRVADEMRVEVGMDVGYCIRFDDCTDPNRTRIKFLTDGMLLRETMLDPLLSQYSVIMLDEAHERSLYTDILLGIVKKIQKKRKDLRLIVSSATLDAQAFKDFFETNASRFNHKDTATIISVEGRQYPVSVQYSTRPVRDYMQACVETVRLIHTTTRVDSGAILIFLTGRDEIERMCELLTDLAEDLRPLPFYAGLSTAAQLLVFQPSHASERKVIVATNVAETSVTIDGIVYVIDPGFAKFRSYQAISRMDSLLVTPISQAAANQRAGRAGRVRPGYCYRLYTEDSFYNEMVIADVPEIQRSNLSWVVLQLKALGIDNLLQFEFMSPPPAALLADALEMLFACGALDRYCKLTSPIGTTLSEFPVEPRLAKMLLASCEMGCSSEILSIAAVLSVQDVFISPKHKRREADACKAKFAVYEGDHLTLLNVYNLFLKHLKKNASSWCQQHFLNFRALKRAQQIRKQLEKYIKKFGYESTSCRGDATIICKCIVMGYFSNAAQLLANGAYKSVRGDRELRIHPSSVLYNEAVPWVVFHEVLETEELYMRDLTKVDPMWLPELAPEYYQYTPHQHQQHRHHQQQAGSSSSFSASSAPSSSSGVKKQKTGGKPGDLDEGDMFARLFA